MASCSSAHSRSRSSASAVGTCSPRPAAWVPSSREKGKKPAQSSCAAARNSSSRSWSRSVSPGIAEDEGRAEGGVGLGGPDVRDAAQEAVAIAPTPHAGEEGPRHVLQREVEVRHPGGEDGVDQLVGQPGGIEVQQPGALDAGRDGTGERGDGRRPVGDAGPPAGARAVAAVGGEVLGHEDDLAQGRRVTGRSAQRVDLGHDRRRSSVSVACPRKEGMAQKPQMRSQPSATFT